MRLLHQYAETKIDVDIGVQFWEDGVFYVFQRDKVLLYALSNSSGTSSLIDFSIVGRLIHTATGSPPSLTTTVMTFQTSVGISGVVVSPAEALYFLHENISSHPPHGTIFNFFVPEMSADVVVKVVPFSDNFAVTFFMKPTGKCVAVGDATLCLRPISASTFTARVRRVMQSFHGRVMWGEV